MILRLSLLLGLLACFLSAHARPAAFLDLPREAVVGDSVELRWTVFNPGEAAISVAVPEILHIHLRSGAETHRAFAERHPDETDGFLLEPGRFATVLYTWQVPMAGSGPAIVEVEDPVPAVGALRLAPRLLASLPVTDSVRVDLRSMDDRARERHPEFLNFSPHEPIYFLVGPDKPNAKFQLSFKYRFFNTDGRLAREQPWVLGWHFAYTQTSLWDLESDSKPFLDTSYKPEFFYRLSSDIEGLEWLNRANVALGFRHESNGQDGLDSRDMNVLYFQPEVTFGREGNLQLTLAPRFMKYIFGLSENPDLKHYRGKVDWIWTLGWLDSWQLRGLGRVGTGAKHGSLQLDLTYPLREILSGSLDISFNLQFFTGYGESLLLYNERSTTIRAGFSIVR
ncbi:MAG: phospholipase A [Opitutales bacterium]|nr:phospholipase A [Opitutales bacterium]